MSVRICTTRTRQPQFFARLSAAWRSAAFAFSPVSAVDLVTGRLPTTNNALRLPVAGGIAAHYQFGQTGTEWSGYAPIVTSDGAGTGDFSMLVIADPPPASVELAAQHMFSQKNDSGGSPFSQVVLSSNANDRNQWESGSVAFFTFSGDTSAVAAAGAADGGMHVYVGVRRGTTHELWRDGVLLASASLTVRSVLMSNRYLAIGSRGNGSTESYTSSVLFAGALNRALGPDEVRPLRRPTDVFGAVFAPIEQRIWVPASASAPTLLTASAINIGTTFATPRVTFTRP